MKSLILYGAYEKLTPYHHEVSGPLWKHPYYVRAEPCATEDLSDALDKAKPLKGETVLNTVPHKEAA